MKDLFIILIPVSYLNSRKICEQIENQRFASYTELYNDVLVKSLHKDNSDNDGKILIHTLSNYMDSVNDQELDNLSEYFMSYVYLNQL